VAHATFAAAACTLSQPNARADVSCQSLHRGAAPPPPPPLRAPRLPARPFPPEEPEMTAYRDEVSALAARHDKLTTELEDRSEERRVGKECRRLCRSRWSPYH
jgi:hypothetical protein